MKHLFSSLTFLFFLLLISCNFGGRSDSDEIYEYIEEIPQLSEALQEKIGSWAEEGAACYGILALIDGEGVIQEGSVIKAKIIRFNGDSVKMKSLVNIKLREVEGCDKMGISRGDTWWEMEGDIYLTEEEAEKNLADKLAKLKF